MSADEPAKGMKRKAYEKELGKLQVELCHLQEWVKAEKLKVIIIFEGRDAAGKGGTIKALTEKVSPGYSVSAPCPHRPIGKNPSCSSSAISSNSRPAAKS